MHWMRRGTAGGSGGGRPLTLPLSCWLTLVLALPSSASRLPDTTGASLVPDANQTVAHAQDLAHDVWDCFNSHILQATTADLMRIKKNGPEDLESLISALGTGLLLVSGCVLALKLMHTHLPEAYGERALSQQPELAEVPPEVGSSLLGWVMAVEELSPQQIMATAGLDALMLGEFHALCAELFAGIGLVVLLVLAPLYFLASRTGSAGFLGSLDIGAFLAMTHSLPGQGQGQSQGQGQGQEQAEGMGLTLSEAMDSQELAMLNVWAQVLAVWFVVLFTLQRITQAQQRFLQFRFQWLKNIQPPRSTTLMVEGIPPTLCSDEALKDYYVRLFSREAIERAYIVRRTRELKKLVHEVEKLENRLAIAKSNIQEENSGKTTAMRSCLRWLVLDAVYDKPEELEEKLRVKTLSVQEERARVEQAVQQLDPSVCSQSAFVTFATRRWCRLASREQLREDKRILRMSMPPAPDDVRFEDLAQDGDKGTGLEWIGTLLKFGVVCTWMPFVVSVTTLADLKFLRRHLQWVNTMCESLPWLEAALEGVLATLLLQMLMGFLPKVLLFIITTFQTLKSGAWAQLELQKNFFCFEVIFVLLVTAINQTILAELQNLMERPQMVFRLLGTNLPKSSHFYVNYLAVGVAGLFLGLLRISMLWQYAGFRVSGSKPPEAREKAEKAYGKKVSDGSGVRMARASFMATVALVFCTSTPVITPFAWAYFAGGYRVFRYIVVYGENQRPDLGGQFWFVALEGLIWGLVLLVSLAAGILSNHGERAAPIVTCTAFLAILVGYSRLRSLRGEILPFEVLVDVEECGNPKGQLRRSAASMAASVYQQPECQEERERPES